MGCIKAVSFEASYSWELKFQRRGQNEDIFFLGFVLLCTRCWLFSGGNWKWLGQHGRWTLSRKTSRVRWIKKNNYKWWLKWQNGLYKGAKYKESILFLRDEDEKIRLWRELAGSSNDTPLSEHRELQIRARPFPFSSCPLCPSKAMWLDLQFIWTTYSIKAC